VQLGVVVPQIEMADPHHVVALAETAQAEGFEHLLIYDHVLGAERASRPDYWGPYDSGDPFHEPFVMFGRLTGHIDLELWTGVLVLPQRQTALVAKQAAELDVLCGGRLRLGVGVGWNAPEYEALGEDFTTRGLRYEEQVELLRALWTHDIVAFEGKFHTVDRMGLNPMPRQRPIPLWMGGWVGPRVLDRIGRLSDGWIAMTTPGRGLEEAWETVLAAAAAAGRPPGAVGLHGMIQPGADASAERIRRQVARWEAVGATHLSVNGMGGGRGPDDHLAFVRQAAAALLG
jgi:probable F420-dependent oxidoreductase